MKNDEGYHYVIVSDEDKVIGTIDLFSVVRHNIQSCMIGYAMMKHIAAKVIRHMLQKKL